VLSGLVLASWACGLDERDVEASDGADPGGDGPTNGTGQGSDGASNGTGQGSDGASSGGDQRGIPFLNGVAPATPPAASGQGESGDAVGGARAALGPVASAFIFAGQEVGTASPSFTWLVSNQGAGGTGDLMLYNSNGAEFTLQSECPTRFPAGYSCTIEVRFAPGTGGSHRASLTLSDGATSATLALQGDGLYRLSVVRPPSSGTGSVRSSSAPGDPQIDCGPTCTGLFAPGRITLSARTENGQNSYFSGWSGGACTGLRRECTLELNGTQVVVANFAPQDHNLIFVSSREYSTDLGGLAAYDAQCNALASAAGINDAAGTNFVAGMSDSAQQANPAGPLASRLGTARGWVRMDGMPFADQLNGLFGAGSAYNDVGFSELGEPLARFVWTALTAEPDRVTCGDWTDAAAPGFALQGESSSGPVWDGPSAAACDTSAPIYCLGRSQTTALGALPSFPGKRIWVSNTPFVPGSMSPDQQCQAERPPGVATGVALLAYVGRAASAVLDLDASYVRPDGQLVGTGAELVAVSAFTGEQTNLVSGPWVLANGTTAEFLTGLWTGSTSMTAAGTANETCNDWQSPGSTGHAGTYGYAGVRFWQSFTLPNTCNFSHHLYCVEP